MQAQALHQTVNRKPFQSWSCYREAYRCKQIAIRELDKVKIYSHMQQIYNGPNYTFTKP